MHDSIPLSQSRLGLDRYSFGFLLEKIKTPIEYVQEKSFQVMVTAPQEEPGGGCWNAPHG